MSANLTKTVKDLERRIAALEALLAAKRPVLTVPKPKKANA